MAKGSKQEAILLCICFCNLTWRRIRVQKSLRNTCQGISWVSSQWGCVGALRVDVFTGVASGAVWGALHVGVFTGVARGAVCGLCVWGSSLTGSGPLSSRAALKRNFLVPSLCLWLQPKSEWREVVLVFLSRIFSSFPQTCRNQTIAFWWPSACCVGWRWWFSWASANG